LQQLELKQKKKGNASEGTFKFEGKSYNTKRADDKKSDAVRKPLEVEVIGKKPVPKANPNTVNKIGEVEVIGKKPAPKTAAPAKKADNYQPVKKSGEVEVTAPKYKPVKKISEVTVLGKQPSLKKFPYGHSPASLKSGGKTKKKCC
jgi:hypothetical protein